MPLRTVALIFGGKSSEHEISVISARAIAAQLDPGEYTLRPVYIDRNGTWHDGSCAATVLGTDLAALLRSGDPAAARDRLDAIVAGNRSGSFDFGSFQDSTDVAFLALHGAYGEDGKIQGCLETFGIPYTGCKVTASAVAMDKELTKLCAMHAGVAVADFMTVQSNGYAANPDAVCEAIADRFAWPVFVKPANLGSSVGITKAHSAEELRPALDLACGLDTKVLVEAAISGRELEVAVLGNDDPVASVPGEIVPGSEFYDFDDKYINNAARLFIPARVSEQESAQIRQAALAVFRALDGSGMSRIDFFLEHGSGRIILNEVNTIPGFTDISMYPMLMAATGVPFPELVKRLLHLAIEKGAA